MTYDIYTDGYRGPYGQCHIGVSIHDGSSEVYFLSQPIGKATSMVAELLAFFTGLEKAVELGIRKVKCHVDAMSIAHWYKGTAGMHKPNMRAIWRRIIEFIDDNDIEICTVEYIPSKQNKRADALSKAAGTAETPFQRKWTV